MYPFETVLVIDSVRSTGMGSVDVRNVVVAKVSELLSRKGIESVLRALLGLLEASADSLLVDGGVLVVEHVV